MNLIELFDLAEKDKDAACEAFRREFSGNRVSFFDHFHYSSENVGYNINPNKQDICIESYENIQKFLQYFGHLMKEFRAVCDECSKFKWSDMVELIVTNCTKLEELHLLNNFDSEDPMQMLLKRIVRVKSLSNNLLRITKPFSALEKVSIENIGLHTPLDLNEIFPNLRSLNLIEIIANDPSFIEVHLPKLQHLGITLANEYSDDIKIWDNLDIPSEDGINTAIIPEVDENVESDENSSDKHQDSAEQGACGTNRFKIGEEVEHSNDNGEKESKKCQFNWQNIKNALILNPQLESIHLEIEIHTSIMRFLNDALPNLQKLELSLSEKDFDYHDLENDIVFQQVKIAILGQLGYTTPPIRFEKLEELQFRTTAYPSTIDFIKKHQSLKSLHLWCEYSDIQALRAVKALPQLKHLYIIIENDVNWCSRALVRFLAECERLDTLMMMLAVDSSDQRDWGSLVAKQWQIEKSYTHNVYTIEKTKHLNLNNH